jgi:molybdopterin-binding protein
MLKRDVRTLSGGERQLVSLARALAAEPKFLLLDEPFVALDPPRRNATRRMVRSIQRERGITVLHVTHDVGEGALLGDVITVLDGGRVLQTGDAPAVFSRPPSPRVAELLGAENVIAGRVMHVQEGMIVLSAGTLTIVGLAEMDSRALGAEASGQMARGADVHAVIRADEIMLSRQPVSSSARNSFAAAITGISAVGATRRVELDAGGLPLVAVVTAGSIQEMMLAPGETVTATFKATAVHFC